MQNKKKISLIALFLFGILFISLASARPLTCADNPLALWHFNEGIGNVTTDSCFGISRVINGSVVWMNGKYGKSLFFNGIDTYIDIGKQINTSFNDMSIFAWVKVNDKNTDYQTCVGRETNFFGTYYWNFALAKDSIYQGYPNSSYFNLFDNGNQNVIGTYLIPQYNTIDDGNWHLLIGTYNGTDQNMSFYYDGDVVGSAILVNVANISSSTDYFLFGTAFDSNVGSYGYFLNGSLDEVALFNRTLTQTEIIDYYSDIPLSFVCYNQTEQQLSVSSYPYVDFNINYPMKYFVFSNNISSYVGNVKIDILDLASNISTFNFNWNYVTSSYDLTLLFTQVGDYSFTIYFSSCLNINNQTGTFKVREPFYVTFDGFISRDNSTFFHSNKYINNFAYVTAEFPQKYYNNNLEPFIAPISDNRFRQSAWYSPYINGEATLKLYEKGEYAIRLIDGEITFAGEYSVPNITKSYGTNVYLGKFTLTNSSTYNLLFTDKDLHPYRWLFNWGCVILIGVIIIVSVFLFFVIPDKPSLSVIFGVGGTFMLTLLRVIIWVIWGW